jgi:hypothetical protein
MVASWKRKHVTGDKFPTDYRDREVPTVTCGHCGGVSKSGADLPLVASSSRNHSAGRPVDAAHAASDSLALEYRAQPSHHARARTPR